MSDSIKVKKQIQRRSKFSPNFNFRNFNLYAVAGNFAINFAHNLIWSYFLLFLVFLLL